MKAGNKSWKIMLEFSSCSCIPAQYPLNIKIMKLAVDTHEESCKYNHLPAPVRPSPRFLHPWAAGPPFSPTHSFTKDKKKSSSQGLKGFGQSAKGKGKMHRHQISGIRSAAQDLSACGTSEKKHSDFEYYTKEKRSKSAMTKKARPRVADCGMALRG